MQHDYQKINKTDFRMMHRDNQSYFCKFNPVTNLNIEPGFGHFRFTGCTAHWLIELILQNIDHYNFSMIFGHEGPLFERKGIIERGITCRKRPQAGTQNEDNMGCPLNLLGYEAGVELEFLRQKKVESVGIMWCFLHLQELPSRRSPFGSAFIRASWGIPGNLKGWLSASLQ